MRLIARPSLAAALLLAGLAPSGQSQWAQAAKLQSLHPIDNSDFGISVDLDGSRAIVGRRYNGLPPVFSGELQVIERTPEGRWQPVALLKPDKLQRRDHFGWSCALSGDRIVASSHVDFADIGFPIPPSSTAGVIHVFDRDTQGRWEETATLWIPVKIMANIPVTALALDGDVIVVGAPFAKTIFIFERSAAGAWDLAADLGPPDNASFFGGSVAIDGERIVIGDYKQDNLLGAVYVVERQADGEWRHTAKLLHPGGVKSSFGWDVDVSGNTIAVGATYWGEAYVFEATPTGWEPTARLAPAHPTIDGNFGESVDLGRGLLAVGASVWNFGFGAADSEGVSLGSTHLFRRHADGAWELETHLAPNDAEFGQWFGRSVAVSGNRVLVSAHQDGAGQAGAAYVFELESFSAKLGSWARRALMRLAEAGDLGL